MAKVSQVQEIVGYPVTLSIGEYRVKEPSIFSVLEVLQDAPAIMKSIADASISEKEEDNIATFMSMLVDSRVQSAFLKLLSSVLGTKKEDLSNLTTSDLLKVLKALKEQVDWEDVKSTFFQVIPRESFFRMFPNLAREVPTSSQPST